MRIMFVTATPPSPYRSRSYAFLAQLAPRHQLTCVSLCRTPRDFVEMGRLHALGVRTVPVYEEARHGAARAAAARISGHIPAEVARTTSPRMMLAVQAEIARGNVELVSAEGIEVAEIVRGLAVPVVWDAVQCASRLARLRIAYSEGSTTHFLARKELRRLRTYERELLRTFPQIAVATERERIALLGAERPLQPMSEDAAEDAAEHVVDVHTIPNGIDLERYQPARSRRQAQRIVFSGPLHTSAGKIGASWLLDEVMPRLWSVRPDIRVTLVAPREIPRLPSCARDPRVSIAAQVEDARPYLAGAAVAVYPLPYAIGPADPALEALATGTPLIATDAAVSSLHLIPGRDVLLADHPDRFARLILRVLENTEMASQLARYGRAYVQRFHSWERSGCQLESLYEAALASAGNAHEQSAQQPAHERPQLAAVAGQRL